jgi:hypothetical protein
MNGLDFKKDGDFTDVGSDVACRKSNTSIPDRREASHSQQELLFTVKTMGKSPVQ